VTGELFFVSITVDSAPIMELLTSVVISLKHKKINSIPYKSYIYIFNTTNYLYVQNMFGSKEYNTILMSIIINYHIKLTRIPLNNNTN